MTTIDWYFDFVSPFAYLQSCRLERVPEVARSLVCHPVVFGAILDHWHQLGPAEVPPKRELTYRHVVWRAARDGIPLRMPAAHPFNPLPLLRLAIVAGAEFAVVRRIFDWVWREGHLPDERPALAALADELGIEDWERAIGAATVKDALRDETSAAIAKGVFGVPSAIIEGTLFWGDDLTDMLLEFRADPGLFAGAAYAGLADLPEGVRRPYVSRR
ncbi:MAG TPA: 2-hydroxychromene-2-carboxylate isomerase [Steroidobacteraceae bacterium]|nr:2-hydroxychromene-2-carboxylate isomerase [Steroidobacteraceae bacterium]